MNTLTLRESIGYNVYTTRITQNYRIVSQGILGYIHTHAKILIAA